MAKTVEDYLNLVTSEHRHKPNFIATITAAVSVLVQIQVLLASMVDLFDIDLDPVGDQLDTIGEWVGVSRNLSGPIAGVFFEWDGTAAQGWDAGVWQGAGDPAELIVLPDDVYLTLIKARIAANHWDGTIEGAYEIWAQLLPQYNLLIQDSQNMSFIVAIQGTVPDTLTIALLTGGYLPLKPEGVQISEYIVPVDTNPLFAWDCDSASLAGWDDGSWGQEIAPT